MNEEQKTRIDLAESFLRQGKYDDAIALLKEVHRASPEEDSALLMLSWAYYDSGNTDEAIKYLNRLLDRELKSKVFTGFAFDELVRIYKQQKDYKSLVEICERVVAAQPQDVGLLTELGNAYLQSGQSQKACGVFEKLVGIEDDNSVFYCNWGEALFSAGLYPESEQAYQKAAQIDSGQADYYFFKIAALFHGVQKHQDTERLLNQCITINASNALYYCSMGDCLICQGQIQKAIEAYEKAVQLDHSSAGAFYNRLGNSLMKAEKYSEAARAFLAAVKYEPVRHYYLNLALAYKGMGQDTQAEMIMLEINKLR
jgi:tetratricopeptide (TPR) repeat protein